MFTSTTSKLLGLYGKETGHSLITSGSSVNIHLWIGTGQRFPRGIPEFLGGNGAAAQG